MTALPATIVMASGNVAKLREIARLLDGLGVAVIAQCELGVADIAETGETFAQNSLSKAAHPSATTGLPAIADDSGLVVDALAGAPGVFSARYAGLDASDDRNIDKLLQALKDVERPSRGAAFHCVASFVIPGETQALVAAGEWRGSIFTARQGAGGFGYDPVFLDPDTGHSAARLTAEEKDARSHRGKALRKLVVLIERHYS